MQLRACRCGFVTLYSSVRHTWFTCDAALMSSVPGQRETTVINGIVAHVDLSVLQSNHPGENVNPRFSGPADMR